MDPMYPWNVLPMSCYYRNCNFVNKMTIIGSYHETLRTGPNIEVNALKFHRILLPVFYQSLEVNEFAVQSVFWFLSNFDFVATIQ